MIAAQNALEKDKLALARTIGLPLAQSFNLTDKAPYAAFDPLDVDALIKQAKENRKDLAALVETTAAEPKAAQSGDGGATANCGGRRRLRRHRRYAGPLAWHCRCDRNFERAGF